MIVDCLENADKYLCLNPNFATAFTMLRRSNIAVFSEGRMEIDGDKVFAVIVNEPGRKVEDAFLETHDNYIDIQFVIEGTDTIGWKARKDLNQPKGKYDAERDVAFYEDAPTVWSAIGPGHFGIYFPEDGHMPAISDDKLHKVIVKVAVE